MRIFTIIFAVMAATFATSASAVTQNFDFRESTYRAVFPANQPVTKTSNRGLDVDVSSFNGPPTDLFFDARGTGANTLVDTNGNPVALFCGNPGCSTLFLNFDVILAR